MVISPMLTGDVRTSLALQRRAREVCVVYPNHPMPPGVTPTQARIGIEIDPATQRTLLFVERGLRYSGTDPRVRSWLEAGELAFEQFSDAGRWLVGVVRVTAGPTSACELSRPDPRATVDAVLAAGLTGDAPVRSPEVVAAALKQTIRGQDRALDRLARQVVRHVGRSRPRRPATFFLIGPTGVGKTLSAERLAEVLTEDGRGDQRYDFLRLDMNEYRERHRVSRLLGAPPGYIGYSDGAVLTDALLRNPHHIVLFDEIDKAHPDVLVVLMNLIDRGRLSGAGASRADVDARRAVLLFTSNQAADALTRRTADADLTDAQLDEVCRTELRRSGVAPELLGRVRSMVAFTPLDRRALAEITIAAVHNAAAEFGLRVVDVEVAAVLRILEEYSISSLGARSIEHAVEECFGNSLLTAADITDVMPVICGHDGIEFTVRLASQCPGEVPDAVRATG